MIQAFQVMKPNELSCLLQQLMVIRASVLQVLFVRDHSLCYRCCVVLTVLKTDTEVFFEALTFGKVLSTETGLNK